MFEIPLLLILIVLVALVFDFTNGAHDCANAIATVVSTKVVTPRFCRGHGGRPQPGRGPCWAPRWLRPSGRASFCPKWSRAAISSCWRPCWRHLLELPHLVFRHPLVVLPCAHRRPGGCCPGPCRARCPQFCRHRQQGAAAAGALAAGGLWGGLPHHVAHLLDLRAGHAQQGQPHLPQDAAGVRGLHSTTSHGLNDAQKTMGIITLALFIFGEIDEVAVPLWVKLACAMQHGRRYGHRRLEDRQDHGPPHLQAGARARLCRRDLGRSGHLRGIRAGRSREHHAHHLGLHLRCGFHQAPFRRALDRGRTAGHGLGADSAPLRPPWASVPTGCCI